MNKVFSTIVVAAGVVALSVSASPAIAATLPEGDRVYIMPCDEEEFNGFLYEVDTVTGVATRVGDWVNPDGDTFGCAGPGAYNPVDGLGYWISWAMNGDYLMSVDLSTGEHTLIGEFTLGGVSHTPLGIAIDGEGSAWVTSFNTTPDTLYSVDLATAELTEVGPTGVTPDMRNYNLAWDPATDAVYGHNVGNNDFYSVNTTSGEFTLFNDDVLHPPVTPYAMAFDSAGQVWGINYFYIVSAPLADLDDAQGLTVINPYPTPDGGGEPEPGNIYSESIIIAPAAAPEPTPTPDPELAATGATEASIASAGILGLLFVIAGVVVSRRHAERA